MTRRVLVVEDNALMRGLLGTVLEQAGFETTTAANAADAMRLIHRADPDALVVDIELGNGPTGLELVNRLLATMPHLGVVFLTRVPDARFVGHSQPPKSPNIAWLRKQDVVDPQSLVDAIEAVLRDKSTKELRADLRDDRPLAQLSSAQIELLRLVADGMTNAEIAKVRGTSVRAVEHLIRRTFQSAGINGVDGLNARVNAVRLIAEQAALPNIQS